MIELDNEQSKIYEYITAKKKNVFIQGQAGTGKSTLINYIKDNSEKNIVLASPTALAATTIGGSTLHSLFRLPPKDYFDPVKTIKERNKTNDIVLKHVDILIIDEISMVRPDMLDVIDLILKDVKHNKKPFGGIQTILVGDLYQLPPIVKTDLKKILMELYGNSLPYFFDSRAYKEGKFKNFELNLVHRQEDLELLENLRNIRNGEKLDSALEFFNNILPMSSEFTNAIVLTPYKAKAEAINEMKLHQLPGKEQVYEAKTSGSFKKVKETPAPEILTLKQGAFVMFTKNDKDKYWVNGNTGVVTECYPNCMLVRLTNTSEEVYVFREVWQLIKYNYDEKTKKITEEKVGEFEQFPLQLGYATTIHKAQSKTLDKVVIDIDRGIFAPGQLYVALSRTRKREDMCIKTELNKRDVILDKRIEQFLRQCLNKKNQKIGGIYDRK